MNGPDGLEQRSADLEQHFEYERGELAQLEKREEEQVDESLLDIAAARMTSFWLDRVTS